MVTGGIAVDSKPLAGSTEEFRGASVEGGKAQRLVKGDVFVIPNGVPHQFTEVQGPFLYYVVKATRRRRIEMTRSRSTRPGGDQPDRR